MAESFSREKMKGEKVLCEPGWCVHVLTERYILTSRIINGTATNKTNSILRLGSDSSMYVCLVMTYSKGSTG